MRTIRRSGSPRRGGALRAIVGFVLAFALFVPGTTRSSNGLPDGYARLLVITDFDVTEVSINDVSYPYEWLYGDRNGVLIPADITFRLKVAVSPTQERTFRMRLDSGETRVILVDIENMGQVAAPPEQPEQPARRAAQADDEEDEDGDDEEDEDIGYLGVSSSPRGVVYVDGSSTGRRTPARRIELEPGRHRVQVFYEEEETMSETKHVLVRSGVNTNVFFRQRRNRE